MLYHYCLFFFFKQKTAYEMRISDWSSDVCSSDLQPDSQFSKGVIRVESETEFRRAANEMLERSDLIIAQSYEPTDYDWRIGVLDGQPLYACRYYMAKDHWPVVKRVGNGAIVEGGHATLEDRKSVG